MAVGEAKTLIGMKPRPNLIIAAAVLGLELLGFSGEPLQGQRVFVTGHSFHVFVAPKIGMLARIAEIDGHQLVGVQSIGGSRVIQHWELADEKNKAKAALIAGGVDVLTMSPNWNVPDEGIDRFVELGLKHNPKLRVLVQESWVPWDDGEPERRVKTNAERDYRSLDIVRAANAKFKAAIEGQVKALNEKHGKQAVTVVPVGDAVLKLRELVAAGEVPGITRQSDLFTDAIGHGKPPVVALAAYCNFACIYRQSPVGLPDVDPALNATSRALKPLLQRIAWETVTAHPMSGVDEATAEEKGPIKQ